MVDIHVGDELVFRAQLGETDHGNIPYIDGKRVVVKTFERSSLLVRLQSERDSRIAEELGTGQIIYGGCIPIFVAGRIAGTITMSGESDLVDHEAAEEALRRLVA